MRRKMTEQLAAGQGWTQHSVPQGVLPDREVHVWRFGLDVSDLALRRFGGMLCEAELMRADRFRFPVLRRRFMAGRGALRAILAGYLSTEPQKLTFSYGLHGKPSLLNSSTNIQFNVSHSDGLMVAAICREWPIGVDIEKEDARFHAASIAARYFCERERHEIARGDEQAGHRAFFQLWTAKEAVLKATGLGLTLELSKLDIGLRPLRVLTLEDSGKNHGVTWHLTAFSPAEGYSGALAVGAAPLRLEYRDFLLPDKFE
jgi:4'-phosphopantetheinyl transferase